MSDETVPIQFDPGQEEAVDVQVDAATKLKEQRKQIARDRIAEARTRDALGQKILRYKLKTYELLKPHIDRIGGKTIGHCRIMMVGEKAEEAIAELDAIAEELRESKAPPSPETRIALMQLKRDCLRLMLDSGESHISAERQASDVRQPVSPMLPFPPGTAIYVGPTPSAPQLPAPVEPAPESK
jgi:hypothetical protein